MGNLNRIVINIVILISVTFFVSCKQGSGHPSDLKDVMKSGRLTVLAEKGELGYMTTGDSIYGFQYELIKAFADSLNVELIITELSDTEEGINSINEGDADMIVSFLPVTKEYNSLIYTESFFNGKLMLVQNAGSDSVPKPLISEQTELDDDTIFITKNSPYKTRLKNLEDEIADTIYLVENEDIGTDSLIALVAAGKLKYTVCPDFLVQHYKNKFPELNFSVPLSLIQNYSWAVHINSVQLKQKFDEFLLYFNNSPEYRKIYNKYF